MERFEKKDMQQRVAINYRKLQDNSWMIVDANQSIKEIHGKLLEETIRVIENVRKKPIGNLYESL